MTIERVGKISFDDLGTLMASTRWISTYDEGIAEWLKNERRGYQVDRSNVQEQDKVCILLLKDSEAHSRARIGLQWRAPQVYSARPMAGVWATPPYLHNGPVLTLYDLLLPASQRPAKFFVGSRKYDPVHLGYVNEKDDQRVHEFDTTKSGNSNSGHEYGTQLSEEEKMQLLEFMKSFKQMPLPKA